MASGHAFTLLLCLSCGLGVLAQCPPRIPRPSCPSGWDRYGQRCFLFVRTRTDWATAETSCVRMGANLASIHSLAEHDYLKRLVNSKVGSFSRTWVGGNDGARDGVWMWTDGSKFDYVSWGRGEPNNNGGRENCLEINLKGSTRYMNDEKCTTQNFYICGTVL